jgi:hypothetical protein
MTENPSAEAKACADEIGYSWPGIEHERIARILDRFAERVCEKRVSAAVQKERERIFPPAIPRNPFVVDDEDSARDERPAPETSFAADLAAAQEPLGAEFEKVLHDSLDQLYVRSERPAPGTKLWLWENGDHYLAYAHEYPTYGGGDPMTLGEPFAWGIFKTSSPPSTGPADLSSTGEQPASPAAVVDYAERDRLGRLVREAWVNWARTQPNPKPSWLVPYDDLSEADKEADRQIGEAIAADRNAAAIRAFGQRVWSDSEEIAYQAGVSDTRARLK